MKLLKIISAVVLLIVLNSCKDFLSVSPDTKETSANFYHSQDDFEKAVIGAYTPLRELYENDWAMTEMRSDNTHFIFDTDNRGSISTENLATFLVEPDNSRLQGKWSDNYNIILQTNEILQRIDKADFDETIRDNLKGQALFLRALAYFDLVKNFGKVPLIITPSTSYKSTFNPRAPTADVYEQIISDAQKATEILPNSDDQDNAKATSGAAYTLLGDVYITLKRWKDAENALKPVTNMSYNLLPNYADIFNPSNEDNNEIIFQVGYKQGTSHNVASTFPYEMIPELPDPTIITGVGPPQLAGGGWNIPTPDIIKAYEDTTRDERYSASIAYVTSKSEISGVYYSHTPYIKKYQHPHTVFGETDQNWIIYRYAEVLLMLSKAINEQGRKEEAEKYLNQVRQRAGLKDTTAASPSILNDIILHERRIELAFENKRLHDLIRTNKMVNVMNAYGQRVKANPSAYYYLAPGTEPFGSSFNVTGNKLIYPIPKREIDINNKLEQNPGY